MAAELEAIIVPRVETYRASWEETPGRASSTAPLTLKVTIASSTSGLGETKKYIRGRLLRRSRFRDKRSLFRCLL